jgi:3-hydroxybutyryl-CoA dehydrogenase
MASITRVAIVGAGTMGRRIAFQCARTGMACSIYDLDAGALDAARAQIDTWLAAKLPAGAAAPALASVAFCGDLGQCLEEAGLVIENVPEQLELKRRVFAEIDLLAPAGAVLATNSSSLPASRIASATRRPERVVNVNFGNPPEDELLVELMAAECVPREVSDSVEAFLSDIGTVPIVSRREIMGFSFNRVWRAIKRECLHLVGDGVSHFEDLDRAWILTFETRRGPFGMMDVIGLDVILDIERQYFQDSGEERDRPPEFLQQLVAAGRLGVKAGRGFYRYPSPEYEAPGWLRKGAPWTTDRAVAPAGGS